jgi:hypothetical protein
MDTQRQPTEQEQKMWSIEVALKTAGLKMSIEGDEPRVPTQAELIQLAQSIHDFIK